MKHHIHFWTGRGLFVIVIGIIALSVATTFGDGLHPRTRACILGALMTLFLLSDLFFWRAMEGLSRLAHGEHSALMTQRIADHAAEVQRRLVSRGGAIMACKVFAGVATGWLASQSEPSRQAGIVWSMGLLALYVSLPPALSFFRVMRDAEEFANGGPLIGGRVDPGEPWPEHMRRVRKESPLPPHPPPPSEGKGSK